MRAKKGNVVKNLSFDRKYVVQTEREMSVNEAFVCDRPHEDGDFSYLCGSDYCRCCQ